MRNQEFEVNDVVDSAVRFMRKLELRSKEFGLPTVNDLLLNWKILTFTLEKKEGEHQCEEEQDWDTSESFNIYQGFHNFLSPQATKLVTHHDLSCYKTAMDLGGEE